MHPVLWSIGNVHIYSYGAMVALGILVATYLCCFHAAKRDLQGEAIVDLVFWIVVGGLVGGRLLYVLLNMSEYVMQPLDTFKIYKGGLAFHGSFLGGLIAAVLFIKKIKLPLWKTFDILFIYIPLGHAFGRIGCFLNGCCYGIKSESFFSVTFPGHFYSVVPIQLYSSAALLGLFALLIHFEKKKKFDGEVFCLYLILYGVLRFGIEFLRDNPDVLGPFSLFQFISTGLFLIGVLLYRYLMRRECGKRN